MWLILYSSLFFLVVSAAVLPVQRARRDAPAITIEAAAQISNLRMFAYAAKLYMTNNPSASGTFYWSDLKSQAELGSGHQNANVASNWKVVGTASDYVLCTEVLPQVAGALGQFFPSTLPVTYLYSSNKLVVPASEGMSASDLQTEADKCT